jgi:hypothetical protein
VQAQERDNCWLCVRYFRKYEPERGTEFCEHIYSMRLGLYVAENSDMHSTTVRLMQSFRHLAQRAGVTPFQFVLSWSG